MSLKNVQFHGKVIENATTTAGSRLIYTADFKSIEFSVVTNDATCDFDIVVVSSIQKTPPDAALPVTADNQWTTDIAYIDESNGATYNGTTRYNPQLDGGAVSKVFRVNTNGATWILIAATSFAVGSGPLLGVNVTLSDNL